MAANNIHFKSVPKQMSDSWIIIDDQDESDFVVIDQEPSPKPSPRSIRPLEQNRTTSNRIQSSSSVKNNRQRNKKRKWKVLYSLASTGIQGSVNAANLDSYIMDQYEQLFDKHDLFNSQQRTIKVK